MVALEVHGWWRRGIGRKAPNGPLLAIPEDFGAPDETMVPSLAERHITVGDIDTSQVTFGFLFDHHLRCISIARTQVNTMFVTHIDECRGTPQIGELAKTTRHSVVDTVVLCPDLVVHASRQGHILLDWQEIAYLDTICA